MWVQQVAQVIFAHLWLALGVPVSIVLNALARATAKRISTDATISSGRAEDQWLKELGVPASERRRLAIARVERNIGARPPDGPGHRGAPGRRRAAQTQRREIGPLWSWSKPVT